jgi:hypothetical protein
MNKKHEMFLLVSLLWSMFLWITLSHSSFWKRFMFYVWIIFECYKWLILLFHDKSEQEWARVSKNEQEWTRWYFEFIWWFQ